MIPFIATLALVAEQPSFTPGEIWLDKNQVHINAHGGGVIKQGKRYYWFGEHKIEGPGGNSAQVGVHCYSSANLCEWKDEGIALKVSEDPASDIVKGCVIERPKVVYNKKTKSFVMWFHLELRSQGYKAARVGVATSKRITGPYSFTRSFRPDDSESRDMTVFQDDDGKAYLFHSSEGNATMHISLLSDDYLSTSGKFVRVFEGRYMEAPAVFKLAGKYYLIASGCTGWAPNAARSAVADSIFGPWTELGNPWQGPVEQTEISYDTQSTFALPIKHKGKDTIIFMADRWRPKNPIDGRYIWLPIEFINGKPILKWRDKWTLDKIQ